MKQLPMAIQLAIKYGPIYYCWTPRLMDYTWSPQYWTTLGYVWTTLNRSRGNILSGVPWCQLPKIDFARGTKYKNLKIFLIICTKSGPILTSGLSFWPDNHWLFHTPARLLYKIIDYFVIVYRTYVRMKSVVVSQRRSALRIGEANVARIRRIYI